MSLSWTPAAQNEYELAELTTASDARVSQRIPMRGEAKLSFGTEAGQGRTMKGRVLNMSTSGVLVEALRPIAIGSQIPLHANHKPGGPRYCRHAARRTW